VVSSQKCQKNNLDARRCPSSVHISRTRNYTVRYWNPNLSSGSSHAYSFLSSLTHRKKKVYDKVGDGFFLIILSFWCLLSHYEIWQTFSFVYSSSFFLTVVKRRLKQIHYYSFSIKSSTSKVAFDQIFNDGYTEFPIQVSYPLKRYELFFPFLRVTQNHWLTTSNIYL